MLDKRTGHCEKNNVVSRAGNVLLNLDKQYPNEIFTVFVKKEDLVNFGYDPVAF